jgi:predicted DNA-binding protein
MVPAAHLEDGFKLGGWVGKQRDKKVKLPPDVVQRLDALGFIWDVRERAWEDGFQKFQHFYSREGHCNVPTAYLEDGFKLGGWVSNQRSKEARLSPERIEQLNALGFVWDTLEKAWEDGLHKFQQFQAREGHCQVLQSHWEDGFKLGGWVSNQRATKATLSPERIERLNNLGFVWDPREKAWEDGLVKLQRFHVREGHCKVPTAHLEDGFKLGGWVGVQRVTKARLSPERIERLNALGFIWDKFAADWEEGFDRLKRFHSREGHYRVPQLHLENGFKLGGWVAAQRRAKKAKFSPERIKRLEALGFVWDTRSAGN